VPAATVSSTVGAWCKGVGGDNAEPLSRIDLNKIEKELERNSCGTFGPIVKDRT